MIVQLNGERFETGATTLLALLEEAGYGAATVATALNGAFVAREARAETEVQAGDQVEVLAPMQGG